MQHVHLTKSAENLDWQTQDTATVSATIKPASLALLLQIAAVCSVLALVWLARETAQLVFSVELTFSVPEVVFMQSVVSTLFAYCAQQAHWWRWIHFGFPFAILTMLQLQLPSEVYLAGFILTTGVFWTTFRSQVPFFPSRPAVWQEIEQLIPQHRPTRVIDIGSGLGDMAMYIANQRPLCRAEGIEIAPLPWLVSQVRGFFKQSRARFMLGDYYDLNFAEYDVIFAYLSPVAMPLLWNKAMQEMKPGSLLISLEFEIAQMQPTHIITPKDRSPKLYVWRM